MSSNRNTLESRSRSRLCARPWASTAVLAVLGGAITVASWIGGEPSLAIMLGIFYVVCCIGAYLWSRGHGDVAAIMRLSGDERQRLIDVRATAIAGLVTLAFCIGRRHRRPRARRHRQSLGADLCRRRSLLRARGRRPHPARLTVRRTRRSRPVGRPRRRSPRRRASRQARARYGPRRRAARRRRPCR